MNVTLSRTALLRAMAAILRVAKASNTKDWTRYVGLQVSNDQCTLVANDLEHAMRYRLVDPTMAVDRPGTAVVFARALHNLCTHSLGSTLQLDLQDTNLVITSDSCQFQLRTLDPQHCPMPPEDRPPSALVVSAAQLQRLFTHVKYASAPPHEVRSWSLACVRLEYDGDSTLCAVSTDGTRLSTDAISVMPVGDNPWPPQYGVSLSLPTVDLVQHTITHSELGLALNPQGTHLHVFTLENEEQDGVHLCCVGFDGRFPKWRDCFPSQPPSFGVDMPAGPLLQHLQAAAVVLDREMPVIQWTFSQDTLLLTARGDVSSGRVELKLNQDVPTLQFGLRWPWVRDILQSVSPDTIVRIEIIDAENPILFRVDDHYKCLVMPIALKE